MRRKIKKWASSIGSNPARIIVSSFAFLILIGASVLTMPFTSRSGEGLDLLSAMFTATSATCVTGLVVVDTYTHFSFWGQVVVLILIQLGGLGLVAFATFFNLSLRRKIGFKSMHLAQESTGGFNMYNIRVLIKLIFIVTFSIEIIGAIALMFIFVPELGAQGVFVSIFLAVSAYCNAGFDILGFKEEFGSLTHYYNNPTVIIIISMLVIAGGLGFIVWQDLLNIEEIEIKSKKQIKAEELALRKAEEKNLKPKANNETKVVVEEEIVKFKPKRKLIISTKRNKLMLHSKIVLISSVSLLLIGTILILAFEWNNPLTLGNMSIGNKVLNAFFQSVTCRTAGFNTIDNASLLGLTKIVSIILMLIGAAPGGTGGGIKVTTVYVLIATVICVLQGKDETIVDNRKIDKSVIYKALAVVTVALLIISITTSIIFFTSHHDGITFREMDAVFEAVSAFGTAGLSNGVTGVANSASRITLMLTMFVGRVGPVSLALSLAMKPQNKTTVYPEAKIMVG